MTSTTSTPTAPTGTTGPVTPAATAVSNQTRRTLRGPSVATILAGLLCLVIAAVSAGRDLTDWDVDWGIVGPVALVGGGGLIALVGLVGMRARRHDRG